MVNKKMFRKSLMRSITIMSNTDDNNYDIHEEKENRIKAIMQTYLAL